VKTSKWTKYQTTRLLSQVRLSQKKREVFLYFAKKMRLSPNSVRNFYYSRKNNTDIKKVQKFTNLEVRAFLREVILGYSRGESIRGICLHRADGVHSKMQRYQNKYRAVTKNHPEMITQTVQELEKEGYFVKNPLPLPEKKTQTVQTTENIIKMPALGYNNLTDQDVTNLFMGVIRLVRKQGQSQIEKLKAEIERLKSKSGGSLRGSGEY
jgi:hypothetical protein